MIKCPSCNGEMKFDPNLQKVRCYYCANSYTLEELQKLIDGKQIETDIDNATSLAEKEYLGGDLEGDVYKCSQCGATLMTFDNTAVTFCSYCGSQAMLKEPMITINNPDLIIPFKKTKEDFIRAYKEKLNSFLFIPKYMKEGITVEKCRGIYMPYGVFDVGKKGTITNTGSKYAYRSGDYVYYNDYSITSDVDVSYDGISFDLVSKLFDSYSQTIPFNFSEAVEFNPSYLIGYYADVLDVDKEVYKSQAREVVKPDITKRLSKDVTYRRHGCMHPTFQPEINNSKVALFPIYFLSIRDKSNKNIHYAIMNGQTGEIAIDLPVDFKKYVLVTALVTMAVFAIIYSFFVLSPGLTCGISVLASLFALISSYKQIKNINAKLGYTEDEGLKYIQNKEEKEKAELKKTGAKKKNKIGSFKYVYKEWLALAVLIFAFASDTVNDMVYYGASIISLCLVVLSFKDLIKEHNLLSTNKLPQLDKRGGDENE